MYYIEPFHAYNFYLGWYKIKHLLKLNLFRSIRFDNVKEDMYDEEIYYLNKQIFRLQYNSLYIIFRLNVYIIYTKLFPMNNQFTRLNSFTSM